MAKKIAGYGGKRPHIYVPIQRLRLDPENPRLPKELRGKRQTELILEFKRSYSLEELAISMSENGYFDEEPLVGVPQTLPKEFIAIETNKLIDNPKYIEYLEDDDTIFTVIEGNRRLATVKILMSDSLRVEVKARSWPKLTKSVSTDLSTLPVIVYPIRKEVLPYMGVRHITGIKKWESYSRAVYVSEMMQLKRPIDEIEKMIGGSSEVRKLYLGYRLIEQAEEELGIDVYRPKTLFSYLILAIGQRAIKQFIGLPNRYSDVNYEEPVQEKLLGNLKDLFSWLFGEGKDVLPVLKESRDITRLLTPVLANPEATAYLRETRELEEAYDRSDGERILLLKKIRTASRNLKRALGLITEFKSDDEVINEIDSCQDIIKDLYILIKEK